jgi:hypothetical protein
MAIWPTLVALVIFTLQISKNSSFLPTFANQNNAGVITGRSF